MEFCSFCHQELGTSANCPSCESHPLPSEELDTEETLGYYIKENFGDELLRCWRCKRTHKVKDWADVTNPEAENPMEEATFQCTAPPYCEGDFIFDGGKEGAEEFFMEKNHANKKKNIQ